MATATLTQNIHNILATPDALARLRQDDAERRRLLAAATKLSLALESQGDSVNRIRQTPLQLSMAKLGVDKHVFEILAASSKPLSTEELADKAGIDAVMLKRILRYWESLGTVSQPAVGQWAANNVTEALASAQGRTAINHNFNFKAPVFMVVPEYFKTHGYNLIKDIYDSPFQLGHNTKLDPWAWGKERPERYEDFLAWMEHARDGDPSFLDSMSLDRFFKGSTKDTLLFVDVSGSRGFVTSEVARRYGHLPGRIFLQDQPHIIEKVREDPIPGYKADRIETQGHDFFTGPTPLKGARVYYLRNILHDWSDEKCLEILASVIPSMTKGESVMLVDDVVLPEKDAPWRGTQLDIEMLVHLAGAERTVSEWTRLLEAAGLQVDKITPYFEARGDSIIEARLR